MELLKTFPHNGRDIIAHLRIRTETASEDILLRYSGSRGLRTSDLHQAFEQLYGKMYVPMHPAEPTKLTDLG